MKPILFILALAAGLTACEPVTEHRASLFVFGTLVDVQLGDADKDEAEQAFADLQQRFQVMHRDWHAWEPGALTSVNEAFAARQKVTTTPDIIELVRRSQELERLSDGNFNPALGGLIRTWGFHSSEYPIIGPPPSREQIETWLHAAPSTLDITIEGETLSSNNPAAQLDFGGIAKGQAADLAMQVLAESGIARALVNAGGDVRARGTPESPWKVGVLDGNGKVLGAVLISGNEAVFTSGVSQRFRQDAEVRYPHVIDPHSGWPVSDLRSATVIANNGALADAAATALLVAGPSDWSRIASRMGIREALVIDNAGNVYTTPAMHDRIHWLPDSPQPKIVDLH
jgi:thiamine biosynthesis lipoprotein